MKLRNVYRTLELDERIIQEATNKRLGKELIQPHEQHWVWKTMENVRKRVDIKTERNDEKKKRFPN